MREIVQVQVGACGNQIGTKFWEILQDEHGLDQTGHFVSNELIRKEKISVYFNEGPGERYVPR